MTQEPKRTYEDDNGPLTPEQIEQIKDLANVDDDDDDDAWSCTLPECMTGGEDSYSGCTGACV